MKLKNVLTTILTFLVTFIASASLVFADSSSSETEKAIASPLGLLVIYICYQRRRHAIGGWLLYFYVQFFLGSFFLLFAIIGLVEVISNNSLVEIFDGNIFLSILSIASSIVSMSLFILLFVFGCMLLSKGYRSVKIYNLFRMALVGIIIMFILSVIIANDYSWMTILSTVIMSLYVGAWLAYFTYSKRVKMVFVDDNRDPNVLYPEEDYKRYENKETLEKEEVYEHPKKHHHKK